MKRLYMQGISLLIFLLCNGVVISKCDKKNHKKKRYDYIIVGGGAAGCIEARKLSDNFKKSVLLLEAGGNFIDDPAVLDSNWVPHIAELFYSPKFSITYPTYDKGLHPYSEGHTFGGGATHNNLLAIRGTEAVYNEWAAITGNSRWDYFSNILPLMKQLEAYHPNGTVADPAQRGFFGPISITQAPPILPGAYPFLDQLSTITLTPFIEDYNVSPQVTGEIGISAGQQFITPAPNSRRSFSALDFLAEVIDENGKGLNGRQLTVKFNANAFKIRFNKNKRATSVRYFADKHERDKYKSLKASLTKNTGILILAAGSVQTPNLLLQSGVGPASQLNSVGVPLVLDSPHVGQNLQDHYGASAIVTGGTLPFVGEEFITGYPYMPNDGIRRIQLIDIPQGPNRFQVLPAILNPKSRGSVTIVSDNPLLQPLVNVAVFTDGPVSTPGTDAYLQVAFYKIVQQAATAAGQTVVFPTPAQYASDATLLAAALSQITLQAHIVGTARMGTDISNGVVDGNLKMFGLENVYIGDNSIQPITSNGNTCYPAYIIALVLCQVLGVNTPPIL